MSPRKDNTDCNEMGTSSCYSVLETRALESPTKYCYSVLRDERMKHHFKKTNFSTTDDSQKPELVDDDFHQFSGIKLDNADDLKYYFSISEEVHNFYPYPEVNLNDVSLVASVFPDWYETNFTMNYNLSFMDQLSFIRQLDTQSHAYSNSQVGFRNSDTDENKVNSECEKKNAVVACDTMNREVTFLKKSIQAGKWINDKVPEGQITCIRKNTKWSFCRLLKCVRKKLKNKQKDDVKEKNIKKKNIKKKKEKSFPSLTAIEKHEVLHLVQLWGDCITYVQQNRWAEMFHQFACPCMFSELSCLPTLFLYEILS